MQLFLFKYFFHSPQGESSIYVCREASEAWDSAVKIENIQARGDNGGDFFF
jgi:hypothetical protein